MKYHPLLIWIKGPFFILCGRSSTRLKYAITETSFCLIAILPLHYLFTIFLSRPPFSLVSGLKCKFFFDWGKGADHLTLEGGRGVGDFEKKFPASACRKKKIACSTNVIESLWEKKGKKISCPPYC